MSEPRWNLPAGWVWAKISDVAQIVGGGTPSSKDENNFAKVGIPWITPADLSGYELAYISKGRRDLSPKGYLSCSTRLIPKGSVLFSSRAPIGYCVIADSVLCTNQGFKSMVLREGMLPEFVRYYLLSAKDYAESLAGGTTFLELSASRFSTMQIPVAPFDEQRRIVDKLDNILDRIEKIRAELVNIPTLLQRYRSCLLQAAYDGTLIGHSNIQRSPLGELVEQLTYGTSKKSHVEDSGIPILRIPNISSGQINLNDLKYSALEEQEYKRLQLKIGDLLVVRSNGSPNLVGRTAVVGEESAGMAFAGYLIRIRPKLEQVDAHYLSYMMQAPASRAQIESQLSSTSGVHNVNAKQLAALEVPIFAPEHQSEIVKKLNAAFQWSGRVEAESNNALGRITDLQTAVLSNAFRDRHGKRTFESNQAEEIIEMILNSPLPELPEFDVIVQQENQMIEEPRESLLKDSLSWPDEGLAFEEIVTRVSIERDQMRDAIFSLLGGETPELAQVFDTTAGRILLKRNTK
ncbi:TPA: restriction endonuclease subunit S [Serratia marcescens]|uniref:restriction endonuclease subunit S n=1 Tax=Enterobacter pseudoroggenkampii TaxID=2996112 RepID=UPI0025B1ED87|nr:restriction endonuclease subunit S [Enterobacter pseudoroggenkampii]WJW85078.1 restriction endonuclease subunit S [Enterobacter pseudoroggenkampii]HEO9035526.1 restriction endonuclease subunit S [Serratia marcescens]